MSNNITHEQILRESMRGFAAGVAAGLIDGREAGEAAAQEEINLMITGDRNIFPTDDHLIAFVAKRADIPLDEAKELYLEQLRKSAPPPKGN